MTPNFKLPTRWSSLSGLASALTLALLLAQSASADEPADAAQGEEGPVVATFRDRLHPEELERWLQFKRSSTDPGRASEELVLLKVLAREAEALGLDREPEVHWRLDRAELAILWPKVLEQALAAAAIDEKEVIELANRLEPMPRRVRLRNIFKRFPTDADENRKAAIRARMESVVTRWKNGEDFRQLARAESDSQTRWQGGLLGNVRAGTLRPTIDKAAMAMEPGQISEILEEQEGLTLLFCEKVLEAVHRTPEELQAIARKRLNNQLQKRLTHDLEQELLHEAGLAFTWPSPSIPEAAESSRAIAQWLEGRLTVDDLDSWLKSMGPRSQGTDMPRDWIERQIKTWVIQRMARLRARRLGLVEASVGEQMYFSRLQTLAGQALTRRVRAKFQPITDDEKRQAFDRWIENPSTEPEQAFMRPEMFELRIIQLPLDSADPRPSYEVAEQLSRQLRTGELDFAQAAEEHSTHTSSSGGGKLGPLSIRGLNRSFGFGIGRVVRQLQVGTISKPVEESKTLWILKLESIEASRPLTFDEAAARIEQRLGQEQAERLQQEVTDELWQSLDARDREREAVE